MGVPLSCRPPSARAALLIPVCSQFLRRARKTRLSCNPTTVDGQHRAVHVACLVANGRSSTAPARDGRACPNLTKCPPPPIVRLPLDRPSFSQSARKSADVSQNRASRPSPNWENVARKTSFRETRADFRALAEVGREQSETRAGTGRGGADAERGPGRARSAGRAPSPLTPREPCPGGPRGRSSRREGPCCAHRSGRAAPCA